MVNRRIDQLNENLDPLTGSELIPIFDPINGTTERISVNTLLEYIDNNSDTFVSGGTYDGGSITFTKNDGSTFIVSGLYTGETSTSEYTETITFGE